MATLLLLPLLGALLSGCLTVYTPMNLRGGFYTVPSTDGYAEVQIASNGGRRRLVLEAWLMHRCAMVTLESGQRYFKVLERGYQPLEMREHAEYLTARIQFVDAPGEKDVFDAAAVRESTRPYLRGPSTYH